MLMVKVRMNSKGQCSKAWSKEFLLDFVCPNGQDTIKTILVGRGESYSLTFNPTKKSTCKVIYQPLTNDPTSCKTGLRFTCSKFRLPNKDAKKCRARPGAKLATSARNRP